MSEQLTGAELLSAALEQIGVEVVFGFPGESSLPFYAALARRKKIVNVLARSEWSSGFMADAYARFSQRVSVCHAPGGIGSPQLLAAIVETYNSSIPVLFISFSEPTTQRGKWSTSSFDHNCFTPSLKEGFRVERASEIQPTIARAVALAAEPRTGPVHVDIPADLLHDRARFVSIESQDATHYPNRRPSAMPPARVQQLATTLLKMQRVVLYAGGGAVLSQAGDAIRQLAEATGAVVVTTLNGKGVIPEDHPHVQGVAGQKGRQLANAYIDASDYLVILGSKTGDKSTLNWKMCRRAGPSAQLDVDPREAGRNFRTDLNIIGDVRTVIEQVLNCVGPVRRGPWRLPVQEAELDAPGILEEDPLLRSLMQAISGEYAKTAILLVDASQASGWGGKYYQCVQATRSFASPRGTGTIGYALPAAIGAHFARPDVCAVAMGGDGGLLMSLHEMETARRLGIPLVFFLLDNKSLGLLEEHQRVYHNNAVSIFKSFPVNWDLLARGFGWNYTTIESEANISGVMARCREAKAPLLVRVSCGNVRSPDLNTTLALTASLQVT